MTFDKMRKDLLKKMTLLVKDEEIHEITAPFVNDDVPEFLKKLDEFEKQSKKNRLIVKESLAAY